MSAPWAPNNAGTASIRNTNPVDLDFKTPILMASNTGTVPGLCCDLQMLALLASNTLALWASTTLALQASEYWYYGPALLQPQNAAPLASRYWYCRPKNTGITRLKHASTTDLKYAGTVAAARHQNPLRMLVLRHQNAETTSLIDKHTGIANLKYTGTVALRTLAPQASEC